jgi:hypothetical protein
VGTSPPNQSLQQTSGAMLVSRDFRLRARPTLPSFVVGHVMRGLIILLIFPALTSCGGFTDAATRIAYDIEVSVAHLGTQEGSTYTIRHMTSSKSRECTGPFKVQFDKVGALIIWCKDASGGSVSSHSTSYHGRFVDTDRTFIVDKPAGSVLLIQIERKQGRAVITNVL